MTLPSWCRRLAADPTIHFIAIGGALALVLHLFGGRADREIDVTPARVMQIERAYAAQFGIPPEPVRREALIDEFISSEMLYREALRLGLDRDDEIVKRRLVQKMQFLLEGTVEEPSQATLRAYYTHHTDAYRSRPRVTFSHYFFADSDNAAKALQAANACARRLHESVKRDGACRDNNNASFPGPVRFEAADRAALVRVFGRSPLIDTALRSQAGSVSDPLKSAYGWHVLIVEETHRDTVPPFEAVRQQVRADYIAGKVEANRRKAIQDLRARYLVRHAG